MRFLVVDSETAGQRRARAEAAGQSSAQSYVATLRCVEPGAVCAIVRARETGSDSRPPQLLRSYDGVFFSGSPLRVYQDTPQVRRQVEFRREVFAAGRHSFGSCAGLQIAVAAAGGEVAKAPRYGIGFGRRIGASAAGRAHALLAGRPAAWDAPTIHSDVVERLPPGGICWRATPCTRCRRPRFASGTACSGASSIIPNSIWPRSPPECAGRSTAFSSRGSPGRRRLRNGSWNWSRPLAIEPDRPDLAWQLGVDGEITIPERRRRELANFIVMLRRRD